MEAPRSTVSWLGPDGSAPSVEPGEPSHAYGFSIIAVILAVILFALSDVVAKRLTGEMPAEQVVWLRFLPQIGIAAVLVIWRKLPFRSARPRAQVLRGIALLGAGAFFIAGLGSLGIAEATAISFVTPAFITLLAILLLGEKVGVHRWAALVLGLAGVLVVVRPGASAFQPAAVLPAASAFCGAVMAVTTRRIGADDPGETTLLWSAVIGFGLLSLSAPWWWAGFDLRHAGPALLMGGLYGIGQYLLILVYSRGDASLVAPFAYVQVIAATALGAFVFHHLPDAASLAGIGLIVMGGAYTLIREGLLPRLRQQKR